MEKDKNIRYRKADLMLLNEYLRKINLKSPKEYVLVHETISEKNKELFLIKKKSRMLS